MKPGLQQAPDVVRDLSDIMRSQISLSNFHSEWLNVVEQGFQSYDSFQRVDRVWFNIQNLIAAVDNGGLISHYYNSGADRNCDTILDLEYLGFDVLAKILSEINALFPGETPSSDINERNKVINGWPDGKYDDLLEDVDSRFYHYRNALEQKLVEILIANGKNLSFG